MAALNKPRVCVLGGILSIVMKRSVMQFGLDVLTLQGETIKTAISWN